MTAERIRTWPMQGALAFFLLLLWSCSGPTPDRKAANASPAPPMSSEAPAAAKKPVNEEEALLAVSRAIRKHNLTARPDRCLSYNLDNASMPGHFVIDVRENHRRASCGGDPQTAPRLFTVRVAKQTGAMFTDANSPGNFRPLPAE